MSESQKRSDIWNYFTLQSKDRAECNHCGSLYSYKGGTTSNLKKHLASKHPTIILKTNKTSSQAISLSEEVPPINEGVPSTFLSLPSTSSSVQVEPNLLKRPRLQASLTTFISRPISLSKQ
ncbi:unnamed protein product [Diabrotica balteata]|uniref:BED-type domain-containing protein n=1 Tax=Diabrotica balteata TaxID=107213 RepID=A0A9N9TFV6_DIABA|nr:unnamed protein product [Diabrotica balteata]